MYSTFHVEKKNMVLIGMPGVGKTTLGLLVAGKLGRGFVDVDELIEERFGPIPEIFEHQGEGKFRDLETETIRDVVANMTLYGENPYVISLGAGAVLRNENYEALKGNSIIVFIERSLEELKMLDVSNRPVSQKNSVEEIYEMRLPYYEKWENIRLDISGLSPEESAYKLAEMLK